MFKTVELFGHRELEEIIPEIIYLYLFQGLSLTQIEVKLFRTEEHKGWLSKSFLNYYFIETNGSNKGIYKGKAIAEVVDLLYNSTNLSYIAVAKLLKRKYL